MFDFPKPLSEILAQPAAKALEDLHATKHSHAHNHAAWHAEASGKCRHTVLSTLRTWGIRPPLQ
jgi:hypothetical protein